MGHKGDKKSRTAAKSSPEVPTALEEAMFSVWLHGSWLSLTKRMTTSAKEATWAAVVKVHRHNDPGAEPLEDDWAWWRG